MSRPILPELKEGARGGTLGSSVRNAKDVRFLDV
jgi:hypothetical protein